jgi:hypothetical protein
MFFISHRGNINGPIPEKENKIAYINEAISKNFDVEIDLWYENKKFYLGHDNPENQVDIKFLQNKKLWIHCKNLESFYELSKYDLNFFWHEEDKITITSKGFFWNYPGTKLSKKSICVMPEKNNQDNLDCLGICSDYIKKYYDRYNNI